MAAGASALVQKLNSFLLLNQDEQDKLATMIVDEMVGLGPLEPLLADSTVADILINGTCLFW